MSPTARSLKRLRELGFVAEVVERFIPGARVRRDFLGLADVLAFYPGQPGVLAVQACVTGDQAKRAKKMRLNANTALWRSSGNGLAVWGWGKRGPRGTRKRWTLSVTEIV